MPQNAFCSTNSRSSGQPKNDAMTLFFHPPSPFHSIFLQLQQYWYLYCFAILGSAATVTHSVKKRLLRNWPGSALRPLATSCAKDYKAHSLSLRNNSGDFNVTEYSFFFFFFFFTLDPSMWLCSQLAFLNDRVVATEWMKMKSTILVRFMSR